MLIYNQAYDPYHTMFRVLKVMEHAKKIPVEIDRLRILDFYIAFPVELLEIKAFRGFNKYKKHLKPKINKYELIIDRKRLFLNMEATQMIAIKSLVSYGLFDANEFKKGVIKRTKTDLPSSMSGRIGELDKDESMLMELIVNGLIELDLNGKNGLKARTKLIEFRYDSA